MLLIWYHIYIRTLLYKFNKNLRRFDSIKILKWFTIWNRVNSITARFRQLKLCQLPSTASRHPCSMGLHSAHGYAPTPPCAQCLLGRTCCIACSLHACSSFLVQRRSTSLWFGGSIDTPRIGQNNMVKASWLAAGPLKPPSRGSGVRSPSYSNFGIESVPCCQNIIKTCPLAGLSPCARVGVRWIF